MLKLFADFFGILNGSIFIYLSLNTPMSFEGLAYMITSILLLITSSINLYRDGYSKS